MRWAAAAARVSARGVRAVGLADFDDSADALGSPVCSEADGEGDADPDSDGEVVPPGLAVVDAVEVLAGVDFSEPADPLVLVDGLTGLDESDGLCEARGVGDGVGLAVGSATAGVASTVSATTAPTRVARDERSMGYSEPQHRPVVAYRAPTTAQGGSTRLPLGADFNSHLPSL